MAKQQGCHSIAPAERLTIHPTSPTRHKANNYLTFLFALRNATRDPCDFCMFKWNLGSVTKLFEA